MPVTPEITATEYLQFESTGGYDDLPLNTPAWDCTSYRQMYGGPDAVGGDRPIPGVPGRLYVPDELDEWTVTLPIVVYGAADIEGTAYDDPREGTRTNLRYLRSNLFRPRILRPVTFYRFDGNTETGYVKVDPNPQVAAVGPGASRIVLKITVPATELTESGS